MSTGGGGGGGVYARLKNFSFYRHMPRDLTEATLSGGTLSLIASMFMLVLFGMELGAYLHVERVTEIQMDASDEGKFRINFNISFPQLACDWVSIDVQDVLGAKRSNITKTTRRYKLDRQGGNVGEMLEHGAHDHHGEDDEQMQPIADSDLESWEHGDQAMQLTTESLKQAMHNFHVLIVNYYAPWCPWSRRLGPVWEETAKGLREKYALKTSLVAFGKIDCTADAAREICQEHHIQAFPSIRVFRKGKNVHTVIQHGSHQHHEHEMYRGPRTVEALTAFAEKVLAEVQSEEDAPAHKPALPSGGHGPSDAEVQGVGCRVSGFVMVSRVPGTLFVSAHAPGHSFDVSKINITHTIHRFAFDNPIKIRRDHTGAVTESMRDASNKLNGKVFISPSPNVCHEHYLKVVSYSYIPLRGPRGDTYEFTTNSNTEQEMEEDMPSVKFTYDLSPMQVVIREKSESFFEFLTSVCAIIGGVYTVSGLLEGSIQATLRLAKKAEMGKLG